MKVEIEIPDEDAKWLETNMKIVNIPKFAQTIINKALQMGKEAVMAAKQGIPITPEAVFTAGMEIGQEIAEESTTQSPPPGLTEDKKLE